MKNVQNVFRVFKGTTKKSVVIRIKPGRYAVAFFHRLNDLQTSDVVGYTKLSWALSDAKAFVE